jgi:hypothetical protein
MIESSVKIGASLPDEVTFQHSVFCQTVLPYRDPGPDVRIWERKQGQVSLSLEAGRVKDPHGDYVPVGLPYGPAARLLLCHLNTEALRTGSAVVDAGDSLSAFVRRLQGFDPNGYQIRRVRDQLVRLSSAVSASPPTAKGAPFRSIHRSSPPSMSGKKGLRENGSCFRRKSGFPPITLQACKPTLCRLTSGP